MMEALATPAFQLMESHALHTVLGEPASSVLPVSGISLAEDVGYVVFRDRRDVVRCSVQPPHPGRTLRWFRQAPCAAPSGYAGITFDPTQHRFYTLVAVATAADGSLRPYVDAYDDGFRFVERRAVDFPLKSDHPGFTAVAWATHSGQDYLFLLCSGHKCKHGKAGRTPGGGRLHVFRPGTTRWEHVRRINLPKTLLFDGFTTMDVRGDRLLVAARGLPAVWLGTLAGDSLDLVDDGTVVSMPGNDEGEPFVNTIACAAWMAPDRIVAVSTGPMPQLHILALPV